VVPAEAELAGPTVSSAPNSTQPTQQQIVPSAAAAPQPFPPRMQAPTRPLRGLPHPGLYNLLLSR
jgi:hypothetical protein